MFALMSLESQHMSVSVLALDGTWVLGTTQLQATDICRLNTFFLQNKL